MKKSSSITVLLCGLIAVIVTILFYILTFNHVFTLAIRWLSLLFLLIVEIMGTIKALKFRNSVLGATTVVVSLIHLGTVLGISIIFINFFPVFLVNYILLNLLLIAIVAVIDILIMHFDCKVAENNKRYEEASFVMDECLRQAESIILEEGTTECKQEINQIVELLKYTNRTELCGTETEILAKIKELHVLINTEIDLDDKVNEILSLLKLRSLQIKKCGKF